MKLTNKIAHDLYIMRDALDTIERHYDLPILSGKAEDYVRTGIHYLRSGVNDYADRRVVSKQVARSFSYFYSHVIDEKRDDPNVVWTIYADTRDALQSIAMEA